MRYLLIAFVLIMPASCATPSDEDGIILSEQYPTVPPNQPLVMSQMIGTDRLIMRSEPKFAGAISSMTYRGQEYINSDDHGRLMQGAIAYNGKLECLNPTQAGGSRDRKNLGGRSTSQRLRSFVSPDGFMEVSTRMAYWFRPGMTCANAAGLRSRVENTSRLSRDIYTINHNFGLNGQANVVRASISYNIASTYQSAVVEALTIYTPLAFDTFHQLDPQSGALTLEPTLTSDEQGAPIILSTGDGASAIAFVSLMSGATYARFRFPDTNKISLVYRDTDGITGFNHYEAAWIIGTRDEVVAQLRTILTNQKDFGFAKP